jgi:cytochrome d ubiquinol oxidase subunit I
MDGLDAFLLARLQFAANITFHILFPTISISLGWVLLYFKLRFVKSQDQFWMDAYQFWVKIFALTFALGVVSGITMSFQFGTNWPGYMQKVGNIAGPLLAYEVLTAFFLEATMLGVMLFARERVSEPCTPWPPCWWRAVPRCRPSGSWRSTPGCRRPPVLK